MLSGVIHNDSLMSHLYKHLDKIYSEPRFQQVTFPIFMKTMVFELACFSKSKNPSMTPVFTLLGICVA